MANKYYEGIGRRKEATARVRISAGTGEFTVNGKTFQEYFPRPGDQGVIVSVLEAAGQSREQFDMSVMTKGGGVIGQRDSVVLGLARALIGFDPDLQPALRKAGKVTRDPRVKERKKPGLKKARKAPTYTKR